ncbi:MAG: aldo/keto reductase [Promethearchaeota archaeon]|nr:MAG: aldo/keto reductase [Candidatus Lokiarchaeota archaeon]
MNLNINSTYKLNNGVEIPVLGFGTWTLKGDGAINAIQWALEEGYRLIDTASMYNNENEVGTAIANSNISREELFITTKVWDSEQGYEKTLNAFEQSLNKLKLEYLDLYLIHWPRDKFLDTWKAMEKLYEEEKIKAIGVSNFTIEHLNSLLSHSNIIPAVNQVEFHPFLYQKELLGFCRKNKIILEAYSPLTKGKKLSNKTIRQVSEKYEKTPAQLLLRWLIEHKIIGIPRSNNKEHITDNASIFDFSIENEDIERLNNLNENLRAVNDPIFK